MDELEIRLRCTNCREYRDFERQGPNTVDCADCGKRHSTDSLYAVGPDEEPDFGD